MKKAIITTLSVAAIAITAFSGAAVAEENGVFIRQAGFSSTIDVAQIGGAQNNLDLLQDATGAENLMDVSQGGVKNWMGLYQSGEGNELHVDQFGENGKITVEQGGVSNQGFISQGGMFNTAELYQSGEGDTATISQMGIGDTVIINQNGGLGNVANVTQQ